ncbi:unnamed protein product [Ectocarpus sp. 6 AP-2014]
MRLSCTLAVGALAVAAKQTCAFHVSAPAIAATSKTTFTSSTSAISGRHAATAVAPARGSRNVLQASLNMPGSGWVRGRAERVKSALVLNSGDATASAAGAAPAKEKTSTLKVGFYLFVWYSLTIGYNIYNKATLNRMNIPWILSTVQLAVGAVYVSLIWALGVRKAPKLSGDNLKAVLPLAALHTTSHIAAVVGLSAGAIGFVQIVKAGEPLFTALFSALFLGQIFALPVYAALLPVVGGVAIASLKELSFTWLAFGGAMTSNVAAASRGVLAKASMDKPKGENMDAGNLYGVMTILATIMLAPFAWLVEGKQVQGLYDAAIAAGHTKKTLAKGALLSGIFFYLYNEVAFYCLDAIHPVTHAVANTVKRVFLIGVSILVFGHKLTPLGSIGSAVAIAGVLLYSLAKQKFPDKK